MKRVPQPSSQSGPVAPPRARIQWDRITAIMATFVGVCALGVSIYTARLQNAQIRAQTWPYLQLWQSNERHTFSLSNRGVGPAQIRDVKVFVDGQEASGFADAFTRLSGAAPAAGCMSQSYFARRVLAANEDVQMVGFCSDEAYRVFADAGARMTREICYCSLLDECWRIDEAAADEAGLLTRVATCPVGTAGKFR